MAVTSGFFNSVNHDRTYNAEQFSRLFDGIISNGVLSNVKEFLKVKPSSGMTVAVGPGRAWFNHTWTDNDSDFYITLSDSDILLDRIDAVVLKVDLASRQNEITVVNGAPSSTPVKPTWNNTSTVYRYPLAFIRVRHEVTSITNNDIENAIGVDPRTPFVTGLIQQASISEIYDFWREEFENWLDHLQDELDDNQAAHLQHQIDDLSDEDTVLNNKIDTVNTNLGNEINTVNTNLGSRITNVETEAESLKIPLMSSEDNTVVKGYAKLKIVNPFNGELLSTITPKATYSDLAFCTSPDDKYRMYFFNYNDKKIYAFNRSTKQFSVIINTLPDLGSVSPSSNCFVYSDHSSSPSKLPSEFVVFGLSSAELDRHDIYHFYNNAWHKDGILSVSYGGGYMRIGASSYTYEYLLVIDTSLYKIKINNFSGSYIEYTTTLISESLPIQYPEVPHMYNEGHAYLYKSNTFYKINSDGTFTKDDLHQYLDDGYKPKYIFGDGGLHTMIIGRNQRNYKDCEINLDIEYGRKYIKKFFLSDENANIDNIVSFDGSGRNRVPIYGFPGYLYQRREILDILAEQTPTYENNTIYLSMETYE